MRSRKLHENIKGFVRLNNLQQCITSSAVGQFLLYFQIGYRSLLVHKFRSFLSVLGIVCGVMAVMAMISTGEGAKQEVLGRMEKMGLKNIFIKKVLLSDELRKQVDEKKSYGLSVLDIEHLRGLVPAIIQVGGFQTAPLTPVGTGKGITPNIIKCTGNYHELLGLRVAEGRFISDQDAYNDNLVCVLGGALAERLGRDGKIGSSIRMNDLLYKVIGILTRYDTSSLQTKKISNENFDDMIFLPLNVLKGGQRAHFQDHEYLSLSQIVVEVDTRDHVESVAKLIHRTLALSHHNVLDYNLIVPLELLFQSLATQRVFNLVLAVTGGISLLVGGIGIMNIMLASVTERKREIGIRRAIGATEKDIAYQFLAESFLLTGCGGLIGLFTGFVCVNLIESIAGWPIQITGPAMVFPFLLACMTGVFFGIYPAIRAAGMDPIQALRTV